MSRNSRIGGTVGRRRAPVLVAALLWAGGGAAVAQEPPKLDVVAGGGLGISEGGAGSAPMATEVFLGAGGFLADDGVVTFDVGATAWLTERWGLGAWSSFASVVGESGGGVLFNPAVRYQRRLRRGHSIHFGVGPGYVDSNAGTAAAAEWVFFPQADVLYDIQAAGNRKFGFRVGARLAGHGLHFVAVLGFTTD